MGGANGVDERNVRGIKDVFDDAFEACAVHPPYRRLQAATRTFRWRRQGEKLLGWVQVALEMLDSMAGAGDEATQVEDGRYKIFRLVKVRRARLGIERLANGVLLLSSTSGRFQASAVDSDFGDFGTSREHIGRMARRHREAMSSH